MKLYTDLHIHSCLSPCADDDMTPANICGMAHIKALDAIAVTDHNSGRSLPYVQEAADYYHLILLPGIEVTTKEEVHLLAYFDSVAAALEAGAYFTAHLPPIKNKPALFGNQLVRDTDDEIAGEEDAMLIGATDIPLFDCAAFIRSLGGAAVPAHVNRGSNGLLINLGFMPPDIDFPTIEVSKSLPMAHTPMQGRLTLHSSDAHQLGNISEKEFALEVEEATAAGLLRKIKQGISNRM